MQTSKKDLPEKYYLQHFEEFLDYLQSTCEHLLAAEDRAYIGEFNQLDEDAQCVLVRIYNRQANMVRVDSLEYPEIADSAQALATLQQHGFVDAIAASDLNTLLALLNKNELQILAKRLFEVCDAEPQSREQPTLPTKSAVKGMWRDACERLLEADAVQGQSSPDVEAVNWANRHYIKQSHAQRLSYFLYLYFGRTSARLNQLSMRDLGVMRTRTLTHQTQARFSRRDEAWSSFQFRRLIAALRDTSDQGILALLAQAPIEAVGEAAEAARDTLYWQAGSRLLQSDHPSHDRATALSVLAQSNAAQAIEKVLRLEYADGAISAVKEKLEQIIDEPHSEALLVFAEDFYARKYEQKRTSVLTDILRASGPAIALDEAYVGNVERGVKQFYEQHGKAAFITENRLWRSLFGLIFWPELFDNPKAGIANEFDRTPQVLLSNQFYRRLSKEIDARLATLTDTATLRAWLLRMSTTHYGQGNGVFRWHSQLLDVVDVFLAAAPLASIKSALLAMATDYQQLKDGFPDLMVVTDGKLRFEEIKAPGDSLRRNQLVTIQMLSRAGFEVVVQSVEWAFNPDQAYVVIDVETTGGNRSGHRVTEVGMVKVRNGVIEDRWQSLINPQRAIPRNITQLTGISNEMVAQAPTFGEVADDIEGFLEGAIFVAHNVNFDYGFIRREFERLDRHVRFPKLCTVKLARQHFPGHASYSLGKLCQALDIPLAQHHRALHDAEAAAQVLMLVQQKRLA